MKHSYLAAACLVFLSGCIPVVLGGAGATAYTVTQERSVGTALDDAAIRTAVQSQFANKNFDKLFVTLSTEVHEGRVLLTGVARDASLPQQAVSLAWNAKGVREVINEIQVTDRGGLSQYSRDAWITNKIKTLLLVEKGVKSQNYKIETVNSTVYLLGIAQNQLELDKVSHIASRVEYVEKVVSHVIFKNDPRRTGSR
jgi:osmotically-inducible protein OsmY